MGGDDGTRTRVNGFAVPTIASAKVRHERLQAHFRPINPTRRPGLSAPVATERGFELVSIFGNNVPAISRGPREPPC
jgi:hypothetical protein